MQYYQATTQIIVWDSMKLSTLRFYNDNAKYNSHFQQEIALPLHQFEYQPTIHCCMNINSLA